LGALQISPIIATVLVPPLDRNPTPGLNHWPLLSDLEELLIRFHNLLQWRLKQLFNFDLGSARDSFVYCESAFKSGRRWTAVSYMFVHGSYAHLGRNLLSLAFSSRGPWNRLGPAAFWTVFFVGGGTAALNSPLQDLQTKRKLSNLMSVPSSWVPSFVPESWRRGADRLRHETSGKLTNIVRPHLQFVGCSAGVSAIAGVNMGIVLETLKECLCGSGNTTAGLMALVDGVKIVSMVSKETTILLNGLDTNVDHGGHLTGFGVGLMFYALFACHSNWRQRQKGALRYRAWKK